MINTQDLTCKICMDGKDEEPNLGKLFRPCLCRNMAVHEHCLELWRQTNIHNSNYYQCEVCHYQYQTTRLKYARLIVNPITISTLSFITIISTVIITAYFIRAFTFLLLGIKLTKSSFALSSKIIWWAVCLIGVISMILCLLTDNNSGNINIVGNVIELFTDIHFHHIYVFELFGYTVSLTGFGLFAVNVYSSVHQSMQKLLNKLGNRVLEVNH